VAAVRQAGVPGWDDGTVSRYALLLLPSANRVYADASVALAQAELALFSQSVLGGGIGDIGTTSIGGVPYVTFEAPALGDRAAGFLASLSVGYALFERRSGDLLRPVPLRPPGRYDDDLITIQKYQGKTNEQFTRLLLNVTVLSSAFAGDMLSRKLTVLDPLCGRGTTLNQALMYGYDAAGIDLDAKDFEAYSAFIQTWLTRKRVKHHCDYDGPVRRNGKVVAKRLQITMAPTKQAWKAGATQLLDLVSADTTGAAGFFRPGTIDAVVTDAPYGVQHGSRTAAKGLARAPLDLLGDAVGVWAALLRPGGAIGIAWNTLVARREDLTGILAGSGLEPLGQPPYLSFRHRVDQAIVRDVVVGVKPAATAGTP
jgi:SAM-dependent methyltransferase